MIVAVSFSSLSPEVRHTLSPLPRCLRYCRHHAPLFAAVSLPLDISLRQLITIASSAGRMPDCRLLMPAAEATTPLSPVAAADITEPHYYRLPLLLRPIRYAAATLHDAAATAPLLTLIRQFSLRHTAEIEATPLNTALRHYRCSAEGATRAARRYAH